MIDLSCPDWADRLRAGRPLLPSVPVTPDGDRAVAVFNKLRLADVPGTPTMEEAGGEWFRGIVRVLMGSPLDPVTKVRLIRELFLLVPKKNNKTTGGALLMLTALLLNLRPRAPMMLTAPVKEVTDIAFNAAAGAIGLDPVLEKKLHVRDHLKTIVHRETKASLRILTFDPDVVTGQKLVAGLIDELHVIAKMSKAASAIRQLRGGMLPFPEAFLAFITTQSDEPPVGVMKAELEKARAIRDGRERGAMLPVLYEFPKEMQSDETRPWADPANWPMVNPNIGKSVQVERLVSEFDSARQNGAEELRGWASQHLNVEIGVGLHASGWTGGSFWEACAEPALSFDDLLRRSEVVVFGGDGGGLDDLLGLAAIGREPGGRWLHWAHAWAHPIVLERRKDIASRLRDFERDGDLTIVDKIGDDVRELVGYVAKAERAGVLDRVGLDPAGVDTIVEALTDGTDADGPRLNDDRIIGIPQGWKLTGVIKTTERRLAEKTIAHCGSPLMAWSVGNAKTEPRGNAVLITKQAAGSAKIDPLMATFNAVALMAMDPRPRRAKYQCFTL